MKSATGTSPSSEPRVRARRRRPGAAGVLAAEALEAEALAAEARAAEIPTGAVEAVPRNWEIRQLIRDSERTALGIPGSSHQSGSISVQTPV